MTQTQEETFAKTLNRTILELKLDALKGLLNGDFHFKSYHFGIETNENDALVDTVFALNRTILELKQVVQFSAFAVFVL